MSPALPYLLIAAPLAILGLALVVRHFSQLYAPDSWRRRFVAMRESGSLPLTMAVVVPGIYLVIVVFALGSFGGSRVIRLLGAIPMAGMFAAIQVLSVARRPTGDRLRCSKCKYDLAGLEKGTQRGSSDSHDARCPECGGQWGWPGGSVRAVKVWSPKWCILGATQLLPICVQFGSIPFAGVMWWNRALLTLAPTSALVQEALTSRTFTIDTWAELATRHPTPAQTARIATQVLAPHVYFSPDELGWLARAIPARAIAPDLIEPRLKKLFQLSAVYVGSGNASSLISKNQIVLHLKPVAEEFGPFQSLQVSVVVLTRLGDGPETRDTFIIPGAGIPIFTTYATTPLKPQDNSAAQRLRGQMTIVLQVLGAAAPMVDESGHVTLGANDLYSTTVPIDLEPQ